MKIKNLFSICLLLALFVVHSNAQTADPMEGCASLLVSFTPPNGFSSYYWDFGDNNNSILENPTNLYSNPGTYTVNFSETVGGTVEWTTTITVYDVPEITLETVPASGCSPLDVNFVPVVNIDPSIVVNSIDWTFGDGVTTSTSGIEPVSHEYITIGTFDIGVTINTGLAGCDNTFLFEDEVSTAAAFDVSFVTDPSPAVACVGPLTVNFTNTTPGQGAYTFLWDFGNGMTSSQITPPAQTYTAEGTYTVTLTAEDNTGCMAQTTQTVKIGPPIAEFEPEQDTICVGEIIEMLNTSEPGTYSWTFGNGASPATSAERVPEVQFNEGGLIEITLTVSANGCSSTAMGTVFVDAPDPTFTSDPTYSCTKELVTTFTPNDPNLDAYLWVFHDLSTSTMANPPVQTIINEDMTIHSINGLNTYVTMLTVTSAFGCTNTFSLEDTIWQPNALFAPSIVEGCAPLEVTFEDQSTNDIDIVLWEWDYGDGTTSNNTVSTDPMHTYTDAGEYPVQLIITDAIGCKDTSYIIVINVGDEINPDFTVDKTVVCPGDTVFFTPTNFPGIDDVDAWHFETDDSRSFHCFQTDELKWAFVSETGTFDVTLTVEYNGCYSSITKTDLITVNGPIAEIDYFIDCSDTTYTVIFADSSHDATNVLWTFGDGVDTTLADLSYTYANPGSYTVYLTAFNAGTGCPASIDSAVINIRDLHAEAVLLDTLLCLGNMYELNSSPSIDVDDRCWRGYTWYFSDPNDRPITTSDTVVEHVFQSPGFNDVRLIARDINGCLDTFDQRVKVFGVYPAFTFDDADGSICLGQLVNFTDLTLADTSISKYEWIFDDGTTSDIKNPSSIFETSSDPNVFVVTLSVTDSLGCNGMTSVNIPLYEPVSDITTLPAPPDICLGETIIFGASDFTSQGSSLAWDWDFGDMTNTSTQQIDSIIYANEGIYTVTLNYTEIATGCEGEPVTVEVSVHDFPDADFSTDVDGVSLLCYNQEINFTNISTSNWDLPDFTWTSNPPVNINPTEPNPGLTFGKGTFEVTLEVATENGCSDIHSETFVVEGPEGMISVNPFAICLDDEISFTLSDTVDVSKWTWVLPDGSAQEGELTIVYPYLENTSDDGKDQIKIILEGASNSCTFSDSLSFDVAQTNGDILIDKSIYCVGDTIFYGADSLTVNNTVFWDFGNGFTTTDRGGVTTYQTGGTYTVNLSIADALVPDCTGEDTKELTIIDSLRVVEEERLVCEGDPVVLNITGVQDYHVLEWTAVDENGLAIPSNELNLSCTNCDTPVATINKSITYTLKVTDSFGSNCFDRTFEFKFSVPSGAYALPNAFTPGINGLNNYFNVVADPNGSATIEDLTITKFEIFNRWGQKVYDNNSPTTGWDGLQNGKPAASDVYLYNIETTLEGCESDNFQGNVTLFR